MAKLIDADGELVAEETTVYADFEDETTEEEAVETDATDTVEKSEEQDDDLPEKYRGKSASEIARMHQELHKRLGEQSEEVGQLRAAFDELVKNSVKSQQEQTATPEPELDDVDFFTNPKEAIAKAIANHPHLKQAQAVAAEMAKTQALQKLKAEHPDMKEVIASDDFRDWVSKSDFRKKLYQEADRNYDFASANELLTLYKDRKGVVEQTKAVERQAQRQAVKNASTGSARSNPEGATSRKIYRRADIIDLMKNDPKRYEALLPEIMKAYEEKRVR